MILERILGETIWCKKGQFGAFYLYFLYLYWGHIWGVGFKVCFEESLRNLRHIEDIFRLLKIAAKPECICICIEVTFLYLYWGYFWGVWESLRHCIEDIFRHLEPASEHHFCYWEPLFNRNVFSWGWKNVFSLINIKVETSRLKV